MSSVVLERLSLAVSKLLCLSQVLEIIEDLKAKVLECGEPFVWSVLPEKIIGEVFSVGIRSGWVFVLKPKCWTPAHFHPNSVQFTVVVEGDGLILIGDVEKKIEVFDKNKLNPVWYVIEKGVSHSVITGEKLVVVVSFHTCAADELLEVETASGRKRKYEE